MDDWKYVSELEDFAKQCINSQKYPNDNHIFLLYKCVSCNSPIIKLTIEHHTGSEKWSFKGIIWGECSDCGYLMRLFTFTGEHREKLRVEYPICDCGNRNFMAGLCERYEGKQGIPGFFDEGIIAGKCTDCKRNQAFVFTD
jgi:hypothetical protein